MKIGVTGTRSGMTVQQTDNVYNFVLKQHTNKKDELHHGDCVGVDVELAEIADGLGYNVVCHPPEKTDLRAYHKSNEIREPFSYFKRNRNIVDECDILLVIPYQDEWQSNGGTWYTHDYANKKNKDIVIFFPNGQIWEKVRRQLF